ncbi:hypothetical protein HAX54_029240 [Datura stramonium]|uniref:Uncharacterized protein n=1 Tax=Datura stramonium TaxID=4076 RepID=A0ABS8SA68_DATST|nr:hypothetical protein [Datura stramonium]
MDHEEAFYLNGFDDIKEALEIMIARHRSMMDHIVVQDEKVIELQKTLTKMASNGAGIAQGRAKASVIEASGT